jgi:hypothetical protein
VNPRDDHYDDMSDVDLTGSGTGGPDGLNGDAAALTRFLTELRSLGEGESPAPTPELEAIFAGATPIPARRRRVARGARRALVAAAAVVAGLVIAAANHALPATAQRVVSHVIDSVTPFHIDSGQPSHTPVRPEDRREHSVQPDRDRGDDGRGDELQGNGDSPAAGGDDASAADHDRTAERDARSGDGAAPAAGDASDREIEEPAARTSSQERTERETGGARGAREASDGDG